MNARGMHAGALAMGIFFVLAGTAFLLEALDVWDLRPRHIWPMVLIGLGVAVLFAGRTGGDDPPEA